MTNAEKHQYLQALSLAVYHAHKNLKKVELIAIHAGLNVNNKENIGYEGARNKYIPVLINGELK